MALAPTQDLFTERLSANRSQLSPTEQVVASWIERHRIEALAHTAVDIGAAVGTSDATVIRAVRALGFSGLAELRHVIASSLQENPEAATRPAVREVDQESDEAVVEAIADQSSAIHKLASPKTIAALVTAIKALNSSERVYVFGVGPSEFPAQYGAFLLNRYGREAHSIHLTGIRLADQLMYLKPSDGFIVFSFGQAFQEVASVIHEARRHGTPIVLITDLPDNKFAAHAACTIQLQRPRVHGLTMNGPTFVLVEALALGLATADPEQLRLARERLNELRAAVGGPRVR